MGGVVIADRLRASVDGWTCMSGAAPVPDAFGCFWDLQEIEGWFGGLGVRADSEDRTGADGSFDGAAYFAARTVSLKGNLTAPDVPSLLAAMQRFAAVLSGNRTGTLVVEELARGVTRQSDCRLDVQGRTKRTGRLSADFEISVYCPDPLRYGPLLTASTGLPQSGGGLAWPLFASGALDWGTPGDPGQITLWNSGSADTPILLQATGPHPGGFEISGAGGRLTYADPAPAGQTIWLNTADGSVLAEGTADRRGSLTHADWLTVPARDQQTGAPGSLTLQYTSLGGGYDPAARLVAQWREADA